MQFYGTNVEEYEELNEKYKWWHEYFLKEDSKNSELRQVINQRLKF